MRIGLVEFILILFIASVTVGPQVALFVDRWLRRANRVSALAARRKAEAQAQMAIEREALLHRFRAASNVFAALAAVALVYALVFRPIDTPPKTYAAPERAERAEHVRSVDPADALNLSAYEIGHGHPDAGRLALCGGKAAQGRRSDADAARWQWDERGTGRGRRRDHRPCLCAGRAPFG